MTTGASSLLGLNAYCWSQTAQNRLLCECVEPAVREIERDAPGLRFWWDRFDAGGPHVVATFTLPAGAAAGAERLLDERLTDFFRRHPQRGTIPIEEAEKRRISCSGQWICEADRRPGLAEEGTHLFFEASGATFPARLTRALPEEEAGAIWELVHELSLWAIEQNRANLDRGAPRTAVRWLASLERSLRQLHLETEAFWRFYAGSLLFGIPKRLAENEPGVLGSLRTAVGRRNEETFAHLWAEEEARGPLWPPMEPFVAALFQQPTPSPSNPWRLPREVVHWTLKQLCLYVRSEIPLILYAWDRNLDRLSRDRGIR